MFRHRTSLLLLQVALGLSILIRCVMQCARPRLGESDESDPRESGVKVAPLKSPEKTRFKRHFHRQSTRTMRLKTNTVALLQFPGSFIPCKMLFIKNLHLERKTRFRRCVPTSRTPSPGRRFQADRCRADALVALSFQAIESKLSVLK